MKNCSSIGRSLVPLLCLITTLAHSHAGITTNAYQIVSGRYVACCGIAGPFVHNLPYVEQSSVLLVIDRDQLRARMAILDEDSEVFRVLENGRVHTDYIEFGMPGQPPPPPGGLAVIHYIVSNSAAGLRFNGAIIEPQMGADRPNKFTHTNVVAIPLNFDPPPATIRVSEVEVCWPSVLGRAYQVEYRSSLTSNTWTRLGNPIPGNGTTNCITDKVEPGEPRRFYRVIHAP